MDNKGEEYDYTTSPAFDFSGGFEPMMPIYIPDADSGYAYPYDSSPSQSQVSSPADHMSVDSSGYPPPPQLSNLHRQSYFMNRSQWGASIRPNQSYRTTYSPPANPFGMARFSPPNDMMIKMEAQSDDSINQYSPPSLQFRSGTPGLRTLLPSPIESVSPNHHGIAESSTPSPSMSPSLMMSNESIKVVIESQPPPDVRTRTPSEKRNFSCCIQVFGDYKSIGAKFVGVELLYAPSLTHEDFDPKDVPKQTILGGTKVVMIKSNGTAVFDNLSLSEASTKHKEREFCLRFGLVDKQGTKLPFAAITTPFYAFSNTKVLARRRNISLRTLSKGFGPFTGGEEMHVVGAPFIRGPSLKLIFRTPHGDAIVSNLELYSETVLFFSLPTYPAQSTPSEPLPPEIKVEVVVTNDGRNFSNPLDFTYILPRRSNNMRSFL